MKPSEAIHRAPPPDLGADIRKARREELAKDLLLKLVETNGGRGQYDINYNVRAAVDYTDALLAELEKVK